METKLNFLFFVIMASNIADGFNYQRVFRQSEICGYHNGHRKYLEEGDTGKLSATNISVPNVRALIVGC